MTDRTHRIAEIIMAHIYTWTDGKTETSHIKFGTAALRSAVNMIDDSITISEFNAVLADLVQRKHLKKIGAYIYGLGTGKGLKRYPVNDKSLLIPQHNPGFNNSKYKKTSENKESKPVTNIGKAATELAESAIASPLERAGAGIAQHRLIMELEDISSRLTTPEKRTIQDKETKLMLLDKLAGMMAAIEPVTADLLSQIKNDLEQGEAA